MAYDVDLDMLENVQQRLSGFVGFCRDQVTAMEALVNDTPTRWEGAAAYLAGHTDWLRRAGEAVTALDEVRARLTTAREAYQAALDANTKMFS
ncbi:WXG100 family type VII secretion target [Nocardia fusca]|uniref:WXG100 family type VII secretion target n=1 Tax=Nocardia fusca TaxID=941183 RepID=UPI00378C76B8